MTLTLPDRLLLVGAGKMGGAMLSGWLEQGLDPRSVVIRDPAPPEEILTLIHDKDLRHVDGALSERPTVAVIAVKPQSMNAVLPSVAPDIGPGTLVISIAAGTTISSIEAHLPPGSAVVRAMPNTPASVGRGMTVAFANPQVSDKQREICTALLAAIGKVAWIDDEALLDPVTAVSGSGPAYVFFLVECLAEAGVAAGLDADLAMTLARHTIAGAGELVFQADESAETLRRNVTSPGGTTAAALEILMADDGMRHIMERAVAAAAKRSQELSS